MPKDKWIKSPEQFLEIWDEYVKDRLQQYDLLPVANNKTGEVLYLPAQKPITRKSFQVFVRKNYGYHIHQYIDNKDKAYNEYVGVITHARDEWEDDQVSGTLTGKYKAPNLTARMLGIGDKQDVTSNGESLSEIKVNIITTNKE